LIPTTKKNPEKSGLDKHISGTLNNLVPVIIQELKNNRANSKHYIEFLNDNDILDY
jgi:hypothetical protein